MKSLLRRKTPTDHVQKPSPPSSVSNIRQSSYVETPLYARFASTKQAVQPQERSRIVVSGPMPLGRPNRANIEADDNRRKREDGTVPRLKLSNGRQGTPPGPQSLRNSFSGSRGVQSSLDGSYQDVRVHMAQAARPPIKVQAPSSSDEQLATSKSHYTTATESVQYPRDVPPSPPLSPQLSPYSQQVVPTTVNQFPPSSVPSIRKSHTTATNIPEIPMRLYPEPRYPTSRSSENHPSMDAPISGVTKIISTEPRPRGPSNHLSATEFPRSPNQLPQASHDIEQLHNTSAPPHQGTALASQSNARVDETMRIRALPELPPKTQTSRDKPDRRTSRTLAGKPSLHTAGTPPPRDSVYQNVSQTLTEATQAPFVVTPPQSPDKHVTPARRANMQTRGQPLIFAARDPESELSPEPMRRGSFVFAAEDAESRFISHEYEGLPEVEQREYQQPQNFVKPLRSGSKTDAPEHSSQLAPHRLFSHSKPFIQEQVRAQVVSSYEDEAPPTAHPAIRKLSKGSVARIPTQSFPEDRTPPFAEHSRKSSYGNRLHKRPSPPARPSTTSRHAFTEEDAQSSWQAHLDDNLPMPSSPRPVPGRSTLSHESSIPPTPPEKSPLRDAPNKWLHHMEHQPPPIDDVEFETRLDMRKSWVVPVPAEAQSQEDDASSPDVEDSQEDVQETHLPHGSSLRESPSPSASSIDGDSLQAPSVMGQLHDSSHNSAVDAQVDDSIEPIFANDPRDPHNTIQQSWEGDGSLLESRSSVTDVKPVARPRPRTLPPPSSPEEYSRARARRRGTWLEKSVPADIAELAEETKPTFYPLLRHLQKPELLAELLTHLSFYEWLIFWGGVSKTIRQALDSDPALCDVALERYLGTVGYARWSWLTPEPIRITLAEMHAYMRGVSVPVHVYAQTALSTLFSPPSEESAQLIHGMKKQTRAFNRVVIRLRAQAEADVEQGAAARRRQSTGQSQPQRQNNGPPLSWSAGAAQGQVGKHRSVSRQSSRAPSPTNSAWSQGAGSQVHLPLGIPPTSSGFRSPLFRLRRAPLLRVFVPSPQGDWLSDASVLECETELRKAGILPLLRAGDVVWDTALGDEGNIGRLVWDGRYLIDLDYTFSQIGDVPPLLPALAFPPSYFHRVIRVAGDRNPIAHLDIRFWGEEILANLQLLQDRVRTETPQGAYHTVVRWVHRSSFTVLPPPGGAPVIMLPSRERRVVDPGWRGTVVVEAEGTNEGRTDLRARCQGVFQPRAGDVAPPPGERERMVWRVLRERSRPGEIWIRAVTFKERLIP